MNTYGYEIPAVVLAAYPTPLNFVPTASIAEDKFLVTADLLEDRYPASHGEIESQSVSMTELEYRVKQYSAEYSNPEEDEDETRAQGYNSLCLELVEQVRESHVTVLLAQDAAYDLKYEFCLYWDGVTIPRWLQASADKGERTVEEEVAMIASLNPLLKDKLLDTDAIRHELAVATRTRDWETCDTLLQELSDMRAQ